MAKLLAHCTIIGMQVVAHVQAACMPIDIDTCAASAFSNADKPTLLRMQSKMLRQLQDSGMLTGAEVDVLRWCSNAKWHGSPRKGLSQAAYAQASALEAFVRFRDAQSIVIPPAAPCSFTVQPVHEQCSRTPLSRAAMLQLGPYRRAMHLRRHFPHQ